VYSFSGFCLVMLGLRLCLSAFLVGILSIFMNNVKVMC
jgi:hypothetical protein